MTNLSDLLPSGGGAKEFTATASGAISQGQTVALQSDGTVKAIASSPSALGTEGVLVNSLNPGSTYNDNINVTYCSGSDRYVVTYRNGDNNFYWTSRVCQANGTQLTVGSAYVIQSYGTNNDTIYYDSSADRVVHVSSSGSGISLRVGEINASTNSITWGTNNTLYAGSWKFRGSCFDTNVNLGFFQANHPTNLNLYGFMISANPSTNFASFDYLDTIAYNASNGDYGGDCTFDSNYNIVIGCYNLSNGSPGLEAQPFRLINNSSGKSFTKGSTLGVVPSSSGIYWGSVSIHWDATAQAAIVLAEKASGSNQGAYTWTIITNATDSLSRDPNNNIGVELAGNSTSRYYYPYHITSDGKNGFIAMSRWQSNYGVYVEGSIQAGPTSPTWTTPTSGNLTGTKALYYGEVAYNTTDQRFLFVYNTNFADTDYRTFNYVTSNRDDFVGIASQAISNAASGKINPQGGVATTTEPSAGETGTPTAFTGNIGAIDVTAAYDSGSNQVVFGFQNPATGHGSAIVGSINSSNNTNTLGAVGTYQALSSSYNAITYDASADKIVAVASNPTSSIYNGYAWVGTVSGSGITFGSGVNYNGSVAITAQDITYDSTSQVTVVCYKQYNDLYARVGTISGGAITFGSASSAAANSVSYINAIYDSNADRTVVACQVGGVGLGVIAGQVSGGTISWGTPLYPASANVVTAEGHTICFDSQNNKVVVPYQDTTDNLGKVVVCNVSGSTVTAGSPVPFTSAAISGNTLQSAFDSSLNKVIITYTESSDNFLRIITGTVSGTSISFDTPIAVTSAAINTTSTAIAYDSNANRTLISYRDNTSSFLGNAIVYVTAGTAGPLTIDTTYYLAMNGSVTASATGNTEIGRAVSTTKLLLKGAS